MPDRLAGAGLLGGIAVGVTASVLASARAIGQVQTLEGSAVRATGLSLVGAALIVVVGSQRVMGTSWRIGVDQHERTELVTGFPFSLVRNPIFSGMLAFQLGTVLLAPTVVGLAAVALVLIAIELQVRVVEEPHLRRAHGAAYAVYGEHVGRFLPRVGRFAPTGRDRPARRAFARLRRPRARRRG